MTMKHNLIKIAALTLTCLLMSVASGFTQNQPKYHKVQAKETLFAISKLYNVTVDDIKKWNGLGSNTISIGETLIVGYGAGQGQPEKPPQTNQQSGPDKYHTVQPKQTLYAISIMYEVTVQEIKNWNNLKSNDINVGQRLIIGKGVAEQPKEPIAKPEVTEDVVKEVDQEATLYESFINRGDDAFSAKDYTTARFYYTEAQKIDDSKQYPQLMLRELDLIMKDATVQETDEDERWALDRDIDIDEEELQEEIDMQPVSKDTIVIVREVAAPVSASERVLPEAPEGYTTIYVDRRFPINRIQADLTKDDGLYVDKRYFVYGYKDNNSGDEVMKRKGVVRASYKIADGSGDSTAHASGTSRFYQISGYKLDDGDFIKEKRDFGLSIAGGVEFDINGSINRFKDLADFMLYKGRLEYSLTHMVGMITKNKNSAVRFPKGLKVFAEGGYGERRYGVFAKNTEGFDVPFDWLELKLMKFNFGVSKDFQVWRLFQVTPFCGFGFEKSKLGEDFANIVLPELGSYGKDDKLGTVFFVDPGIRLGINLYHNLRLVSSIWYEYYLYDISKSELPAGGPHISLKQLYDTDRWKWDVMLRFDF